MPVISTYASASNRGFSSNNNTSTANPYWLDAISLKSNTGGMINSITTINNTPYIFGFDGGSTTWKPYIIELNDSNGSISSSKIFATQTFPTQEYVGVTGVTKDSSNNLHVLFSKYLSGTNGFLLVKYDSTGTLVYNKVFSGTSANIGYAVSDLIKDSSDNLYVVSIVNGSNFILTKIDSTNYTVTWSKTVSITANLTSTGITNKSLYIDNSNNIYVITYTNTGTVSTLFKFNTSGTIVWQKSSASFPGGLYRRIDFDSSGNIYLLANVTNSPIVVKLNSSGSTTFTKTYTGVILNNYTVLKINTDDNIVLLGRSSSNGVMFIVPILDSSNGDVLYNNEIINTGATTTAVDLVSITGSLYITCTVGTLAFTIKVNNNNSVSTYNTPWSISYLKDNGTTVTASGTITNYVSTFPTVSDTTVSFTTTSYTTSNFDITITDRTQTLGSTTPYVYYTPLI